MKRKFFLFLPLAGRRNRGLLVGLLACSLCSFLLAGCRHTPASSAAEATASDTVRYARGFHIRHYTGYTEVEVTDPWDSTRLLQRYLLIDREKSRPAGLPKGTVVKVPVRKAVVYTSVHAAMIDQLGETDQIIGVCEPRYMDTPVIQAGVASGRIADLGEATSPNVEKMIELGAELILASPFQNSSYGPVEKTGIPIVEAADYMESSPLGRTEWIRFYGLLFGQEAAADSIFRATEQRYLDLARKVDTVIYRPTVLAEKRFGSSWFVPGADSYMARMFRDAGANYVFRDLAGAGSLPLAFEAVLNEAMHADIWLIKYNQAADLTYTGLKNEYSPYAEFDAFKNRRIFGCNTGRVPYYEEFPLHPDYLLEDLVWLFHPELMPGYTPRYFVPMPQ